MAITTGPKWLLFVKRVYQSPAWLMLILSLLFFSFSAWRAYHYIVDQPLSMSKLAAQRLSIKTAELRQLTDRLSQYRITD